VESPRLDRVAAALLARPVATERSAMAVFFSVVLVRVLVLLPPLLSLVLRPDEALA
jgi:hypothetical protein